MVSFWCATRTRYARKIKGNIPNYFEHLLKIHVFIYSSDLMVSFWCATRKRYARTIKSNTPNYFEHFFENSCFHLFERHIPGTHVQWRAKSQSQRKKISDACIQQCTRLLVMLHFFLYIPPKEQMLFRVWGGENAVLAGEDSTIPGTH